MLKESNLFPPLKKWLNNRGYKVYSEVCIGYTPTDVVAELDDIQIGFEMKMNCSRHVIYQATKSKTYLNAAYVVIPTNPKKDKIELCERIGLGIIQVKGETVTEILKPKFDTAFQKINFTNWTEGETAGNPCLKGIGPQQQCIAAIKEYLKLNPGAKWPELYKNIPNHYASYQSMQNSMRIWRGFRL